MLKIRDCLHSNYLPMFAAANGCQMTLFVNHDTLIRHPPIKSGITYYYVASDLHNTCHDFNEISKVQWIYILF